jgi:hypothetical protein
MWSSILHLNEGRHERKKNIYSVIHLPPQSDREKDKKENDSIFFRDHVLGVPSGCRCLIVTRRSLKKGRRPKRFL